MHSTWLGWISALLWLGFFRLYRQQHPTSRDFLSEAETLAKATQSRETLARLSILRGTEFLCPDADERLRFLNEAVQLAQHGEDEAQGEAHAFLAEEHARQERWEASARCLEAAPWRRDSNGASPAPLSALSITAGR